MVGIIDGLDVVEVRSPVFEVALLAAGNQPVVAMRPFGRGNARLVLIVVSLMKRNSLACRSQVVKIKRGRDPGVTISYIHDCFEIERCAVP